MTPRINVFLSSDETLCFDVPSETADKIYLISYDLYSRWLCDCPDYYYRKRFCKHMKACAELTGIDDSNVYHDVKDDWGSTVLSHEDLRVWCYGESERRISAGC